MRRLLTILLVLVAALLTPMADAWTTQPLRYTAFDRPARWFDTREGLCITVFPWPFCPTGALVDQEYRHYQIQSVAVAPQVEIPLGAEVAVLSVTVTEATTQGRLVFYRGEPLGGPGTIPPMTQPGTTSISFAAGQTTTALVNVRLGDLQFQQPGVDFYPDILVWARLPGGGSVHLIVDVIGYYDD